MNNDFFGTEKISKILLKMAPPVMLAQLIQALYNVVDSFFVGRYSESGLTALSILPDSASDDRISGGNRCRHQHRNGVQPWNRKKKKI